MFNVAGDPNPGHENEIIRYALTRWDRTAMLCAIKLTDAMPGLLGPLIYWLVVRR